MEHGSAQNWTFSFSEISRPSVGKSADNSSNAHPEVKCR